MSHGGLQCLQNILFCITSTQPIKHRLFYFTTLPLLLDNFCPLFHHFTSSFGQLLPLISPLYLFFWTTFAPYFTTLPLLMDNFCPLFHTKNNKVHPRTDHRGPEGEQRYNSTLSLTSALDVSGWSTPRPSRFTPPRKRPGAHCTGGWVGSRAGLDR